ncbi:MAG TPA: FUSC family membrane protein [Rhizomicrobium sp.]|nr:FUSC family membrane protein [Rhizomicrobium sp.]
MAKVPTRLIPNALALAVFRVHIENGLSVALGVGFTGLLVGWGFGFQGAIAAAMGAVAASISDQPDPLRQKPWILGFAMALVILFTALASFAAFHVTAFVAATFFAGLFTGLISAYGKRALSLSMTAVLAFVFAMGQHFAGPAEAASHLAYSATGVTLYTLYAGAFAWAFDDRGRRLLLAEAMLGFAGYLRAKAALYNPDMEGNAAFHALIESHAVLVDRLQTARDALYARRDNRLQWKRIDTLIALLDAFEAMLSSDADFELLRRSGRRELKWRINALILHIAAEVDDLTLALRRRHARVVPHPHTEECEALLAAVREASPEDSAADHAFAVTASKLKLADNYVAALARALDSGTPPSELAGMLDLNAFRAAVPQGLDLLWRQFSLEAPAMRYAIRLALAMTAGLAITLVFPRFAHANWVLLTIALIMRANYSVTSRRRWDRVTGTLMGCAIAVALILVFPSWALLITIVLAVGVSHAYGLVRYRITATAASISSLLLLHFSAPLEHPQFFERIVDTLIGAGLSWAFSFLLPSWERDNLPRIVRGLLTADAGFANAALRLSVPQQNYRLARKKVMDAVALLSGAIRRLADEPNINRRALAALTELLGANYLLASDLASMPVLVKLRGPELPPEADDRIEASRAKVLALLSPDGMQRDDEASPPREGHAELKQSLPMALLARRLAHIEYTAGKVARLAARPVIETR